ADLATARAVAGPIVSALRGHPSLRGYNLWDDTSARIATKAAMAVQVFRELDPDHPASPTMVDLDVYRAARPEVFIGYHYPARAASEPCDFYAPTLPNVGGSEFSELVRETVEAIDPRVPLWLILQSHGSQATTGGTDATALRVPTVEEERLEHWL